jgi:nanoRNase/pAp phosphatase (c-di-AMP/oligoRNAs hydrolase)
MDNLTFSKIKEAIEKYENIAVVTRGNPSVDEMGAALSLYLALKSTGKNITVASPSTPLVEVSSLVGIDEVTTSLGSASGDLVVSFPYRDGEIEKVSYTRDENFLNIVVKAGEKGLNFSEKDVKFTRGATAPEVLFVIGSPRVSDLGNLFDPAILKDTMVVNIDNKADNQGYGDILMVSSRLSSVSEAVANLILALNLKLDLDISQNLMLGIATATENFQSENTSPLAFEMAGVLLRQGALRPTVMPQRRKMSSSFEERVQPQVQQAPQPQEEVKPRITETFEKKDEDQTLENPPEDWLEPKIYKGSTSF